MAVVASCAEQIMGRRKSAAPGSAFRQAEELWAALIAQNLDFYRGATRGPNWRFTGSTDRP